MTTKLTPRQRAVLRKVNSMPWPLEPYTIESLRAHLVEVFEVHTELDAAFDEPTDAQCTCYGGLCDVHDAPGGDEDVSEEFVITIKIKTTPVGEATSFYAGESEPEAFTKEQLRTIRQLVVGYAIRSHDEDERQNGEKKPLNGRMIRKNGITVWEDAE